MAKITVYQKPTCTTCRQVYAALKESGVDFDAVDYYTDPIPKTQLTGLLKQAGDEAERAAEESRHESARSASDEGSDLQETQAGGSRSGRRRDHRPDGQA